MVDWSNWQNSFKSGNSTSSNITVKIEPLLVPEQEPMEIDVSDEEVEVKVKDVEKDLNLVPMKDMQKSLVNTLDSISLVDMNNEDDKDNYDTLIVAETIDELKLGQEEKIFMHRLKKHSPLADPRLCPKPPMVEVLSYVAQMKKEEQYPWFISSQKTLVDNDLSPPDLPVLHRPYIQTYLIQYIPRLHAEFPPCSQARGFCQAEIISKGRFRLRALKFPNEVAISNSNNNMTPSLCFLCHLEKTNALWLDVRDSNFVADDICKVYCIQEFMVVVNVHGEYNTKSMIPGKVGRFHGIFAPFPIYNIRNYNVAEGHDGLNRIVESDDLVFRLPQVESGQIGY